LNLNADLADKAHQGWSSVGSHPAGPPSPAILSRERARRDLGVAVTTERLRRWVVLMGFMATASPVRGKHSLRYNSHITVVDSEENNDLDNGAETVFDYWNEDPELDDEEELLDPDQLKMGMEDLKEWAMEAHPEWFEKGFKAGGQSPNPITPPSEDEDEDEDGLDEAADDKTGRPAE
jgi:hypothetical protein